MLFQSQVFVLLFLPAVLMLFYALARHQLVREWLLVIASLVFYGWWDVRFVPLLVVQTTITWILAELVLANGQRRWLLPVGIVANLAVLAFFKYTQFFATTLTSLTGNSFPEFSIILPIGISFFTFELICYLVDIKRGVAPRYPLRQFCLFVFFFPHLIAGPILRHNDIIPQLALSPLREGVAERISRGMVLFTLGFAKKVFIADKLATIVDPLYTQAATTSLSFASAWIAALGFTFQLYFDFSAYSDMALGLGWMFGILLPLNFNVPYRALHLRDFWRRWHITLSRYLTDYVFIPLGGSRNGIVITAFATIATMGLSGLWHGAGWTFVVWGLMHGAGLIVCRGWQTLKRPLPAFAAWLLTFIFIVIGWVVFRSPDFTVATHIFQAMMFGHFNAALAYDAVALIFVAALVSMVGSTAVEAVQQFLKPHRWIALAVAAGLVLCVLEVGRGAPQSFVYFQF